MKKVISMNYGSSTSSWKPWRWVKLDLIFTMRDIYINSNLNTLTKFTSSSRSTEFNDILPRKISEMITKTIPISTRIVKVVPRIRTSRFEFDRNSMETETTAWSDQIHKFKSARLWESESGIQVGKLTIWMMSLEIESYNRVHQVYKFHQNRLASPYNVITL